MIEYGHEHYFQPVARHPLADGGEEIHRQCVCGLEERRRYLPDTDVPYHQSFRFNGIWLAPLDVLRLAVGLPFEECPDCHGEQPYGPCARCGTLGVLEGGAQLGKPALVKHR